MNRLNQVVGGGTELYILYASQFSIFNLQFSKSFERLKNRLMAGLVSTHTKMRASIRNRLCLELSVQNLPYIKLFKAINCLFLQRLSNYNSFLNPCQDLNVDSLWKEKRRVTALRRLRHGCALD
jgi:hypothetical protein